MTMATSAIQMPDDIHAFLLTKYPQGLFFANTTFYAYKDGAWDRQDELADVEHRLACFFGADATARNLSNAIKLLKAFLSVRGNALNPEKHLICLKNGTLNTRSYELLEHSPQHMLTNRTNVEWNPNALAPRWLQFLDECFASDMDKAQKIDFVQEWMGYCLVPDTSQHKFVWMVGAGGNGKSVLIQTLVHLLSEDNVSHVHIEQLSEKFVRASLDGKLLNVSSEMSAQATLADRQFKTIVSGEPIQAEFKNKDSFSFRPTVRMLASTNHLPRLLDLSDGFTRRAVILTFNRQFAEHEQDKGLEGKLIAELSGILAWAVEGLRRLRDRGKFVIPDSSVVALERYGLESDPVALFADECLEKVTSRGMPPSEVYQEYGNWCVNNGYSRTKMVSVNFGKRLAALGFEKRRPGGKDHWLVAMKTENYIAGQSTQIPEVIPLVLQGPASPHSNAKPAVYKL